MTELKNAPSHPRPDVFSMFQLRAGETHHVFEPDRKIIRQFFDRNDPTLFSKAGLYKAVEGRITRPEARYFILPDSNTRTSEEVTEIASSLAKTLDRNKAVYLKQSTGSGGHGLMKIIQEGKKLELKIPHADYIRDIERGLDKMRNKNSDDFIISYPGEGYITIPTDWPGIKQPTDDILRALVMYGLPSGEYIQEAPIQVPKYNGKTWEIRNIILCPDRTPILVAQYAKVGKGEDFSNILLGGMPEVPKKVIEGVHDSNLIGKNGDTDAVLSYLKENDTMSIQASELLISYMRSLAMKYLDPSLVEIFYPKEFSVDITGEVDENGKLRPVLGELQYPLRPEVSYIHELEKIDPEGLERIREAQKRIATQDDALIQELISEKK